jgi:hypothetical protein
MFNQAARKVATGIFILLSGSFTLQAQKSQSISIFKNGSAFIKISDTVKSANGVSTIPVPSSVRFGTLWLGSSSASIASLRTVQGNLPGNMGFDNIHDMLANNIGKRVRLVLEYEDPVEATVGSLMGTYAIFKTKDRWITTDISKIETIEFLDEPVLAGPHKGRLLEITWENTRPVQDYTLQYMRDSIGWIPEYFIELGENNTATLRLNANVVNNALDITNAEVNFVVGVPNFQQGNLQEPLSSEQDISEILAALGGGQITYNVMSNVMEGRAPMMKNIADNSQPVNADGTTVEDYFFYTLKNISLKKGQRASIPLLEANVPVRDIYAAELPSNNGGIIPFAGQKPRETQVYHSIELTNMTSKPWTSGSAFLVTTENGQQRPLAQDILPYAPKGAKSEVKITVASDIKVTDDEQEIARDSDQKRKNGQLYDDVTVEAHITVKNYKDKPVTLDLHRIIYGDLQKSDADWKTTREVDMYNASNPKNNVTWEVTVNGGDEKVITYHYKVEINK